MYSFSVFICFLMTCAGYCKNAKNVSSGICGHRMPRSAFVSAQSADGLYCPLTEKLDTTECTTQIIH